ncbi:protein OSCP1 [Nilaparvata lugens]|uniref:protein OSCP1 n=1 Tax=Nilaparvata lugens TaxID=108931 RepID=UPI000B9997A5|nr:protein OSCP1 [Nilaparvata lugens]
MAQYSLPLIFLNLGGEMLYVLDQRLKAQKIQTDKARKVLNDIAGIMLNQRFLDELFKPQEIYNRKALCTLFHDLAHASIMRLNEASMSKLYDLMTMAFKQQMVFATEPRDIILVTLNHLDNIRYLITAPSIHKQLDSAYFLVIKTYGQMSFGELQRVRYNILNFLQDTRVRVSIFLRQNIQNNDGTFRIPPSCTIPYGNEVPGSIRVFGSDGCILDLLSFNPNANYTVANEKGSTELRGTRHTTLGNNMYSNSTAPRGDQQWDQPGLDSVSRWDARGAADVGSAYRDELNLLLTQLLGPAHAHHTDNYPLADVFRLNLFEGYDEDVRQNVTTKEKCIANSEDDNRHNQALHKINSEMAVGDTEKSPSAPSLTVLDLLDLVQ